MPAKAPYDGFYDVQYYYADPAVNYQKDPVPAQPLTLANFGGRYMPITSNEFWQQKAPGQVVIPSYVDYTNTMYALGPPDNITPAPRLRYGADEPISFGNLALVVGAIGVLVVVALIFLKK